MKPPKLIQLLFALGIISFILANFYFVRNSVLGLVLGFIFIYKYGPDLGRAIFPRQQRFFQTVFGGLTLLGGITIFQWLLFYIYQINDLTFAASLILSALIVEFIKARRGHESPHFKFSVFFKAVHEYALKIRGKIFIFAYIITYIVCLFLIINHRSSGIIASPWQLIAHLFFGFFGALTILLILIAYLNRNNKLPLILFIAQTFLMSSVALIIYQIGYGYDPFLHLAAEKVIDATGTLTPKTFYYIGEYSLIIFLKNLTQLPLDFFNRALLPIDRLI